MAICCEIANLLALLYLMLSCVFVWCPGSGVVFDTMDFCSLPSSLPCYQLQAKVCARSTGKTPNQADPGKKVWFGSLTVPTWP